MLRRGTIALSRFTGSYRAIFTTRPAFSEAEDVPKVGKEDFVNTWEQRVPNTLKAPNFSSDWTTAETKEEAEAKPTTEIPKKLTFNFYMPTSIIMKETEV